MEGILVASFCFFLFEPLECLWNAFGMALEWLWNAFGMPLGIPLGMPLRMPFEMPWVIMLDN